MDEQKKRKIKKLREAVLPGVKKMVAEMEPESSEHRLQTETQEKGEKPASAERRSGSAKNKARARKARRKKRRKGKRAVEGKRG